MRYDIDIPNIVPEYAEQELYIYNNIYICICIYKYSIKKYIAISSRSVILTERSTNCHIAQWDVITHP